MRDLEQVFSRTVLYRVGLIDSRTRADIQAALRALQDEYGAEDVILELNSAVRRLQEFAPSCSVCGTQYLALTPEQIAHRARHLCGFHEYAEKHELTRRQQVIACGLMQEAVNNEMAVIDDLSNTSYFVQRFIADPTDEDFALAEEAAEASGSDPDHPLRTIPAVYQGNATAFMADLAIAEEAIPYCGGDFFEKARQRAMT